MMPSAFGKFGDIVNGCFFGTQPLNRIHVYKCQFATAFYLFYDGRDGNDIAVKNEDDLAVTVQTAGKVLHHLLMAAMMGESSNASLNSFFHVNTPCKINILLS